MFGELQTIDTTTAIDARTHRSESFVFERIGLPRGFPRRKFSVGFTARVVLWLYEIRDALKTKFRGKSGAINALRIAESQWNRLGDLANDQPLNQGRHRGLKADRLRD